jgi:hypothetical protein
MDNSEIDPSEALRRTKSLDRLCVAALSDTENAREAWAAWLAEQDIDRASWSEVRLLGVVAGRLPEIATGHQSESRLPGIRKFLWVQTQGCLQACAPLIADIAAQGVPILLLKGAARVALNPRSAAERLIRDVDILVPPAAANRALRRAMARGWVFDGWQIDARKIDPHAAHHAWSVRGPGGELDIHHFSNHLNRLAGDDDGMWSRAQAATIMGTHCVVAAPSDALLTSLAHGVRYSTDGARDWMVDACELVKAGGVDWGLFCEEAQRRKLESIAVEGMEQIERAAGGQILPARVRESLNSAQDAARQAEMQAYAGSIWPREHAQQEALAAMAIARARDNTGPQPARVLPSGRTNQLHYAQNTNRAPIELQLPTAARAILRILLRSPQLEPGVSLSGILHLPGLPLGRYGIQNVDVAASGVVGMSFQLPIPLLQRRGMTWGAFELRPPRGIAPAHIETIARWDFQ